MIPLIRQLPCGNSGILPEAARVAKMPFGLVTDYLLPGLLFQFQHFAIAYGGISPGSASGAYSSSALNNGPK